MNFRPLVSIDSSVPDRVGPEIGYLVDAPYRDAPLVITFGFANWDRLPQFDFVKRLMKLEFSSGHQFNRIFIRDTANLWYQHGVPGLGYGVDQTVTSIRNIISHLQPTSLMTLGQSMGAYAAILFGCHLGADRTLAFGPLSYLRSDWAIRDGETRWLSVMEKLNHFVPPQFYNDLADVLGGPKPTPAVTLVYGGRSDTGSELNLDRLHAQRLSKFPSVEINEICEAPHAIVQWLIDKGAIDRMLLNLLSTADAPLFASKSAVSVKSAAVTWPQIDMYWQGWIAENIVLGCDPNTLLETLVIHGFNPADAQREIDCAGRSPYLTPSIKLSQRLAKRDWLLDTQRRLQGLATINTTQPPRYEKLSREDFLQNFYSTNLPVILTGMINGSPAMRWTFSGLEARFSERRVQVQTNRDTDDHYEIKAHDHRNEMTFHDFIRAIDTGGEQNDIYMTAGNAPFNQLTLPELWDDLPSLPEYLTSEPGLKNGMLWMGPAGTITPAHHDLTNNLVAQLVGRKRVWLIDSRAAANVYNWKHVYSGLDISNIDLEKYPAMRDVEVFEFDLVPGDLLFIPIGWWHQVRALSVSVSATFTNFVYPNGFYGSYPADHT